MTIDQYLDTLVPHDEITKFLNDHCHHQPDCSHPTNTSPVYDQCLEYLLLLETTLQNLKDSYVSLRRRQLTKLTIEELVENYESKTRGYREELERLTVTLERVNT